jgi:hypothetical protein
VRSLARSPGLLRRPRNVAAVVVTNDRVVVQEDGGELFLLHLDTGRYFALNKTGLLVWQAVADGQDPFEAVRNRYPSVPSERLDTDVTALLDQLRSAELVSEG